MEYRIKKITTKNDKVWYMPQYKHKFRSFSFSFWKDLNDDVPFYELGYKTKEEAQHRLNIRILADEIHRERINSMTPDRVEYEYMVMEKDELVKNAFQTIFNNIKSKQK